MWMHDHTSFQVAQLPALQDNYIYLILPRHSTSCLVVDPAETVPVIDACQQLERQPDYILNTHHHWDHTGANLELKRMFGCKIIGSAEDKERIPGLDLTVCEQPSTSLGGLRVRVIETPGHTRGHIVYLIEDALFCGDTLFGAGCGRLFEGTAEQMWSSLKRLARLPEPTRVYCAHEYTLANLAFASRVDADNPALSMRLKQARACREKASPTIPSTIGLELQTNPFLRVLNDDFRRHYAMRHGIEQDEISVFAHLRRKKDRL
ncbi:MAG: hydroxyacylglutathione hydrolase [Zetaproteobacteria bacterium]|nr:MAG: hydroxyacylglutathione hydrolase [Zetaproteobacteria bacterium]